MSASIKWRPVKHGTDLDVDAPSSFIALLERLFGLPLPLRLGEDDLADLRAAARTTEDKNFRQHLEDLQAAIENHEEIEVFAEY